MSLPHFRHGQSAGQFSGSRPEESQTYSVFRVDNIVFTLAWALLLMKVYYKLEQFVVTGFHVGSAIHTSPRL